MTRKILSGGEEKKDGRKLLVYSSTNRQTDVL